MFYLSRDFLIVLSLYVYYDLYGHMCPLPISCTNLKVLFILASCTRFFVTSTVESAYERLTNILGIQRLPKSTRVTRCLLHATLWWIVVPVSSLTGLDWLVSVRANNNIFASLVKFNPVQRKATIQSPFPYIKYSVRWRITIIYICSLCLTSVLLDRPASARSITAPVFVLSQEKTVLNSVLRLQGLFL